MTPISRPAAAYAGLTRYFTGVPCKYGHIAERLVSNFGCLQCEMESRKTRQGRISRNAQHARWRASQPEKRRASRRRWYLANREAEIRKSVSNGRNRRRSDVNHKLRHYLRTRMRTAVKNGHRGGSVIRDLGCTIPEFRNYIAARFQPGMSWANWAHDGWHLDHKKPLASFDLTDRVQFLQACHFTNYQPLWAADNIAKGSQYA